MRPRNFKENSSFPESSTSLNNLEPIIAESNVDNFKSLVCKQLNPLEVKCFDFCVGVLTIQKITHGKNKDISLIEIFLEVLYSKQKLLEF